jgi:hypothetical protein
MGFAYTPGLTVAAFTAVRKVRRLPLKGEVLVHVGQHVQAEDVVAQTCLPGPVKTVNVVGKLGIAPEDLREILLKTEGDPIGLNEPFVRTKGLFGLFKSELPSPIDGSIESISEVTGQVIFRGQPTPLQKRAYAAGEIVETHPGESATVLVRGTFIQGIFGIGGEVNGPLEMAVKNPDQVLDAGDVKPEHKGKIIVGGSLVTAAAVKKAVQCGVKGIVAGGLQDADLRSFLGYELGVAITGEETLGVTIMVTEGFGRIRMAHGTFDLLSNRVGKLTSLNGATQIRAGVIRPEVLIPLEQAASAGPKKSGQDDEMSSVLQVGTPVRAIRDPYFGRLGKCIDLPVELVLLPSEAKVRVLAVEFENGEKATVPRANVELIKN